MKKGLPNESLSQKSTSSDDSLMPNTSAYWAKKSENTVKPNPNPPASSTEVPIPITARVGAMTYGKSIVFKFIAIFHITTFKKFL